MIGEFDDHGGFWSRARGRSKSDRILRTGTQGQGAKVTMFRIRRALKKDRRKNQSDGFEYNRLVRKDNSKLNLQKYAYSETQLRMYFRSSDINPPQLFIKMLTRSFTKIK